MNSALSAKYKEAYAGMLWLILQGIILESLNWVDMACVNSISADAIIAVTFALVIYNLIYNAHNVFAKGLRVIASRLYGANDRKEIASSLSATVIITLSITITITVAYLILGRWVLGLFALTAEQVELANSYILARLSGYIIFSVTSPIVRSLEAQGQIAKVTRLRSCNVLNIVLSIALLQPLGVVGVGLASALTELVELVLILAVFKPKFAKPKARNFVEVAKIGASYLPESLISPITNTVVSNLCLIYLSTEVLVISQLVNKLYDGILSIMYATTQHAELTVGREYGAGNAQGIADEFKVFRHCYIRLLLIHIPVTMLLGWAYLSITHVTDMTFALILLFARVACEIAYYTELPARRVLYIFGNIKPAMLVKMFGLTIPKLVALYISLLCGAGAFSLPICYFFCDLPCMIVSLTILHKKKYLQGEKSGLFTIVEED